MADIVYIASCHTAFGDCRALDARHVRDDGTVRGDGTPDVVGEWICGSRSRFNAALPEHRRLSSGHRPDGEFTQKLMSAVYHKNHRDRMGSSAGVWDRAGRFVRPGAWDLTRTYPFEGQWILFWVVRLCCYSLACSMGGEYEHTVAPRVTIVTTPISCQYQPY